MSSLEGGRGEPRIKPPFPAVAGLYGMPTVVNNVETLCNVPFIVERGADWFLSIGTENSPGTKLFSVSGMVKRPGNYELPLGITMRELIYDVAGGLLPGRTLKAVQPGGASSPVLLPEHLDLPLDFDTVQKAGSILGTAGVMVFDNTVCLVRAALYYADFFAHESCGQCTPCREGTRVASAPASQNRGRPRDVRRHRSAQERQDDDDGHDDLPARRLLHYVFAIDSRALPGGV